MNDCYIVSAVRTPIGKHRGGLAALRPDDLLAHVFAQALLRAGVDGAAVDEAFAGCANQAGEDNRNIARMAVLLAGLPDSVPACTVNRLCGSGLDAIAQGARLIALGQAEVVLAGGVESMSRAPWSVPKPSDGYASGKLEGYDTALGWRYPNPKLEARFPLESMGETAENVAVKYGISRAAQDAFALSSHQKAVAAQQRGAFSAELVPLEVVQRKGAPVRIEVDEGPRADASFEALSKLKPAFRSEGSVTAGNSSTLNDGAAAVVLASEAAMNRLGLQALARFVTSASAGVDPRLMGMGPVPATRKALRAAGWTEDTLDLIELNEAFAAQALACQQELELDPARINVNGGAIALGHPLGMSGARLVTTLVHAMAASGAKRGLATMCVGVGQGVAALVERP
jgi:3-oxoadipyl-CoA thiolase